MTTNELIDLMKEFGVEVRMLGTDEKPDANGVALADMLMEIHRLRTRLAAERAPQVPSDEELARIFNDAWNEAVSRQTVVGFSVKGPSPHLMAIRAVRAALGPAPPVIPDGIDGVHGALCRDGSWRFRLESMYEEHWGTGLTWLDALTAAIAAAQGGES